MCFLFFHIILRKSTVTFHTFVKSFKISISLCRGQTILRLIAALLRLVSRDNLICVTYFDHRGAVWNHIAPAACHPCVGDTQRLGILNGMTWKACMFDLRSEIFGLRSLITAKVSDCHYVLIT